jgi:hypothetical protein
VHEPGRDNKTDGKGHGIGSLGKLGAVRMTWKVASARSRTARLRRHDVEVA